MTNNKDPFKNAFEALKETELPTEQQKERMLNNIMNSVGEEQSLWNRIHGLICVYPWRAAFGISTVQTVVFTLIFGTRYTNLFLRAFGG